MIKSQKTTWIVVLALVFLLGIGLAFIVGAQVRPPNEQAITNSQTTPVVTAAVEEREFKGETPSISGQISTGTKIDVTLNAADVNSVVTALAVAPGDAVSSGKVIGRVSGRPVIALDLPFALYRDIAPGESGDDVFALQQALKDLGLYPNRADGVYGPATQRAVKKLYTDRGLTPPRDGTATGTSDDTGATTQDSANTEDLPTQAPPPAAESIPVKQAEFFALTRPPAVVQKTANVGTVLDAETPLAVLQTGKTTVTGRVPISLKESFATGKGVIVLFEDQRITGNVVDISEFREIGEEEYNAVPGVDVTVELESQDVTDGAIVEVTTENPTGTQTGLAVPVTALRQENDQSYVIRAGTQERIGVDVVVTQDGWALVNSSALRNGDTVEISS